MADEQIWEIAPRPQEASEFRLADLDDAAACSVARSGAACRRALEATGASTSRTAAQLVQ